MKCAESRLLAQRCFASLSMTVFRELLRIVVLALLLLSRSESKPPGADCAELTVYSPFCPFSIFAHVSFNDTVRLKTSLPFVESGSTQK